MEFKILKSAIVVISAALLVYLATNSRQAVGVLVVVAVLLILIWRDGRHGIP